MDVKTQEVERPGNSVRSRSIIGVGGSLANSFLKTSTNITSSSSFSVVEGIFYQINRSILLTIFFFLAIYKNFLYIYRRVFLRILTLAYYPSKTPQVIRNDVHDLAKMPKRISCILDLRDDEDENGGVDGLINDISELAAWSISAGIHSLTIYEYNGILNDYLPVLNHYITRNLAGYFGTDSMPVFAIKVPHSNKIIYSNNPNNKPNVKVPDNIDLNISLISRVDGKPTIVELTKTMSELALNKELNVKDITIELIDEELNSLVGSEPDLILSFGPSLDLQDYPPWHIRLSEIYYEPDNMYLDYAVFLRALQKFSNCKVNLGK